MENIENKIFNPKNIREEHEKIIEKETVNMKGAIIEFENVTENLLCINEILYKKLLQYVTVEEIEKYFQENIPY